MATSGHRLPAPVLPALALVLVALAPLDASRASDLAARGTRTTGITSITPAVPIVHEATKFAGRLSTLGHRTVHLQRWNGQVWRRVATATTTSQGRFTLFGAANTLDPRRFRVSAPPATVHSTALPEETTPTVTVHATGQTATLRGPGTVQAGARIHLRATFDPARSGRPVGIQRWTHAGWKYVTTSLKEDASGDATFTVRAPGSAGSVGYRAVALPWHWAKPVHARLRVRITAARATR